MLKKIKLNKKFKDYGFKWQREICKNDLAIHPANTTVHYQAFEVKIDWIDNFAKKKFKLYTISVLKQPPNMLIPLHKDTYYYFRKKFKVSKKEKI